MSRHNNGGDRMAFVKKCFQLISERYESQNIQTTTDGFQKEKKRFSFLNFLNKPEDAVRCSPLFILRDQMLTTKKKVSKITDLITYTKYSGNLFTLLFYLIYQLVWFANLQPAQFVYSDVIQTIKYIFTYPLYYS